MSSLNIKTHNSSYVKTLSPGVIFTFGSNLAGRHESGAAATALAYFGAVPGISEGRSGQSYAIPTKNENLVALDLDSIERSIVRFVNYARSNQDLDFFLTEIGCGVAGYQPPEIASLFLSNKFDQEPNIIYPKNFFSYFENVRTVLKRTFFN